MHSYIKILIADDDNDDAAFLIEGISNIISAYQVFTAQNGVECLKYLENNDPPDLLFLDLNMPLKNGVECLQVIRQNPKLKDTYVIIYSTSNNQEHIDLCYELGAKFYIIKPVTVKAMTNVLKQMFVALGKPASEISNKTSFVIKEGNRQSLR